MEVHLADNSTAMSHQIMYLLLIFAYFASNIVKCWALPALNDNKKLRISLLHQFNPSIDW